MRDARAKSATSLTEATTASAITRADKVIARRTYLRALEGYGPAKPTRPCPVRCEICGAKGTRAKSLCIDHDHTTGEFRGWLCSKCNSGLGMLGDSEKSLRAAVRYLFNFRQSKTPLYQAIEELRVCPAFR